MSELIEEYGCIEPVRWGKAKMIDDKGNEIDWPKCGCGKSGHVELIGKEVSLWLCVDCAYGGEK